MTLTHPLRESDLLVFDFGGVIARYTPKKRAVYLSEHTGLCVEDVTARLFESGLDADAELGRFDTQEIISVVRSALDNRITEVELVHGWSLAFETNVHLLSCVAMLPQRVALFSNNGPMLVHCFARSNTPLGQVSEVFSNQIWSWQLRSTKPAPASFERAAHLIGVAPENLVLFDDTPKCVEQARNAGWRAELVTDPDTIFTIG
jgi:FMN phosphatase YigB (HAD superfamily)